MIIFVGLAIALLGAVAIACGVLGLSNFYVAQWTNGSILCGAAVVLLVAFVFGWERYLTRLGADRNTDGGDGQRAALLPAGPAVLSSFWLLVLAAVLGVGAWQSVGTARWLSVGTALVLAAVAVAIFVRRPRPLSS
ncbi:hypothetical protein [Gloeobacter kilaueensis]|uniref:Uncharacterized protein n=1 Tax=Gloeobacter kilaueensis (strain ATCC BAA-2537 / CCAP 1431/1 / ULC 316 / JS1) TaxID=1183438 RepID=U5QQU0_GLOK1|nr:hypothetical protein [Gloeobacter kilaueensis]AGY59999.1 hypothetical protein GKIL_3753 [Gloeobacter kilaueensis JS1]